MAERKRRISGNLIYPRLQELLERDGWGATERLAARLQLLADRPGFEGLRDIRPNAITELRFRTCTDKLVVAIALAFNVDIYYLLGMIDDPTPRHEVRWPDNSEMEDSSGGGVHRGEET